MIDKQSANLLRGHSEEMSAVLPIHRFTAKELQIELHSPEPSPASCVPAVS
jgi:hypothetical protein